MTAAYKDDVTVLNTGLLASFGLKRSGEGISVVDAE
jgi:hypothetical protein